MEDWVLVEEVDYKSTAELCGKMGDEKTLDNFIPRSESDFAEYAELVAQKLRPYEVCDVAEDEPVPGLLMKDNKRKSNWDDEDLDDNDMKDPSEEEEDEPAPEPKTELMPTEKAHKKTAAKTVEKKQKRFEALKEAPLDPVEEKLCQQRLVGEADYKYTAELFGKMGDEKTLDDFIPKSESDFTVYAELVVHKLRPYEESYHYIEMLKAVMRLVSLKDSDFENVVLYVTAILNQKIEVEKEANAGKKKTDDEPDPSLLEKDYNLNSNWDVEDLDDNDVSDSWVHNLKSNWDVEDLDDIDVSDSWGNMNSNWDVEDLDDNDVKDSWEHKPNSNWDVGDLDDNDMKDSWDESAGKKRGARMIEDEPVPSLLKKDYKLKSNWDDEDLDDNDVKDSSEEEEEEDEPAPEPKTELMPTEKAPKKTAAKTVEKKQKRVEALKEAPLDPVEEKLCQQRLVGEADYKSTAELFGKMGDEKTLDDFIPKSESDFTEYAELVVHKLRPYEKSYHYIEMLKAVMRLVSLKDSDFKDLVLYVTAILNPNIEVEKEANAGKKKTDDEPDPSLLEKDYNLNSNWDVEDLDDNDVSYSWVHNLKSNWDVEDLDDIDVSDSWGNMNSNWDVEDLDDNDVKDSWEEDESAGKKREVVGNTNSNQNDEQYEDCWDGCIETEGCQEQSL